MADKNQFDEDYQFDELGTVSSEEVNGPEGSEVNKPVVVEKKNKVIRNAAIVILIVVLMMLIYKFVVPHFMSNTKPVETTIQPPTIIETPKPEPIQSFTPPTPTPTTSVTQTQPNENIKTLEQKLNALENSQQSARGDINSVSNQLSGINTNLNDLNTQITKLNQALGTLSATVTQQSQEIAVLVVRNKPRPVVHRRVRHYEPSVVFYLQAVIPGRAWIVSTKGSTLTVRQGNTIPGYGVVKLIDAQQGRVITGSGRVIKFSQEDS